MYFKPLIDYAIAQNLAVQEDACYLENRLLELFAAASPAELPAMDFPEHPRLRELLTVYTALAVQRGIIPDDSAQTSERFAAQLMGYFTPLPSVIALEFSIRGMQSAKMSTDWFYHLCLANGSIRTDRSAAQWKYETEYGTLDITAGLLPRKSEAGASCYPECPLCREQEGAAGGGQNLRLVPLRLQGEPWYFRFAKEPSWNEHCILSDARHIPLKTDRTGFAQLLDFVSQFPHYSAAAEADTAGADLQHAHFAGGREHFPLEDAQSFEVLHPEGYEDPEFCVLNWPVPVLRISGTDRECLAEIAEKVLNAWKAYAPEKQQGIAAAARTRDGQFVLDLLPCSGTQNCSLSGRMGRALLPAGDCKDEAAQQEAAQRFVQALTQSAAFPPTDAGRTQFVQFVLDALKH